MKKKNPFEAVMDGVSTLLQWCCILIMAFLIVAVAVQVFARRVLNNPTSWSEPMAQIAFIWLTIFGCAVVVRDRAALNVDLVQTHLGGRLHTTLLLVCDLISMVVCAFWLYSSILQVSNTWNIFEGGLKLRRGIIYVGIAFSFGVMVIFELGHVVEDAMKLVRGDPDQPEPEGGK